MKVPELFNTLYVIVEIFNDGLAFFLRLLCTTASLVRTNMAIDVMRNPITVHTCPILPGYFKSIPPLEQATAMFPTLSTHTAPTVSRRS